MKIKCNICGVVVSNDVPDNVIIRAWVECHECAEKYNTNDMKKVVNIGKDSVPDKK